MTETGLQAFENRLLNKSLSSVSVSVEGDMPDSLAVTLSRALAGQTALKVLDLRVAGMLSFCGANLIERGMIIVKNNSLSELKLGLKGELPDNWQAIVENLNVRLTEKSTVTSEITPNTSSQVTAIQFARFCPCEIKYGFFEQERVTLNVWGELNVDGAEAIYSVLSFLRVCHLTLNIHGKLTDDFLHCTARHVAKQKPLCPITINTWEQLTNEGKSLFKELELHKNPAVTFNVCEVHVPSDESGHNNIVSIDNPESLIALLKGEENTGKETINVQGRDPSCVDSDDSTCDDSDCFLGRSWYDSLGLAVNWTLESLTLTTNNCTGESAESSSTLISLLERFISLKSLTLTINEYNNWNYTYAFLLREGLERNTSLISLTLTVNLYSRLHDDFFYFNDLSINGFASNISMDSFTLAINDFRNGGPWDDLQSGDLWPNYKSLNTFNLTLNNCCERITDFFGCIGGSELVENPEIED
ncbi:uncharacterized protein LOC122954052 [Acropora millepora]|uniref:uncharacterized protein LOC122954052 n=1 Tax=Acropora millepora TaxID=45264 RepID=UPI001CF2C8F5|nr:uncharacterized protein LOC122954052 [Acropora millepora]